MNKHLFCIICLLFNFCIELQAQEEKEDSIIVLNAFVAALKADVDYFNHQAVRQRIEQQLHDITLCLETPYSKKSVESTLIKIEELNDDKNLTTADKKELDELTVCVKGYQKKCLELVNMLQCDINEKDSSLVFTYLKRDKLDQTQIKSLLGKLRPYYVQQGKDSIRFDVRYVFLNRKLQDFKRILGELQNVPLVTSDEQKKELRAKLETMLRIESEITEEHKTYLR